MTQETIWRPNAPFRQYRETDESIYKDGYESGLNWPAKWNHVPGGPYYPKDNQGRTGVEQHPDWNAYCRLLRHHHTVWIQAWYAGFAENAKRDPAIKRLRSHLLMDKLAKTG